MVKYLSSKLFKNLNTHINNERGAQSLEWLGIAGVVIILLGLLSGALADTDQVQSIVDSVFEQISSMIG